MISYFQAVVIGLLQGVTELFPVSSLGHSVLVPAFIGGSWESLVTESSTSTSETSPYLAIIVALHVATALALIIFFRSDWVRIIRGFGPDASALHRRAAHRRPRRGRTARLAAHHRHDPRRHHGAGLEHTFRTLFAKPLAAAIFLTINGLILLAGEVAAPPRSNRRCGRLRRRRRPSRWAPGRQPDRRRPSGTVPPTGHAALPRGRRHRIPADVRIAGRDQPLRRRDGRRTCPRTLPPGRRAIRVPAGHPGNPRRRCAQAAHARRPSRRTSMDKSSSAPSSPDVAAYLSVRWLTRYFETRTLTPFAIYCVVAGVICIVRFA